MWRVDAVTPHRKRNHTTEGRGPSGAGHKPHLASFVRHPIPMDRCQVAVHTQAEQLPTHLAHIGPARDDLLADVASFRETEGGFRGHLEGERVLVHVRAESRDASLDSKELQRVAPDGRHTRAGELPPLLRKARVGRPNRVAGCPGRLHPAYVRRSIATRCDRQESVSRYSTDFDTEHGTDRR